MKRKAAYLSFLLTALLIIGTFSGDVISSSNSGEDECETQGVDRMSPDENGIDSHIIEDSADIDVPTWEIGTSWTYYQQMWQNDSDTNDYMYIEEEITYTVEAVEYITYQGNSYYGYNLTLDGEIIDGEGEQDGDEIEINGGTVGGYRFNKISDLGTVIDRQYRYMYGTDSTGFVDIDIWTYMNQTFQPVIENYDFPMDVNDMFWGNTTMRSWGYYRYDAGTLGSNESRFDENSSLEAEVSIPYTESVTVPSGSFDTYYVNSTMNEGGGGYMDRWFSPEVLSYVKEVSHTPEGDWIKRLTEYTVPDPTNSLAIEPREAEVGDEVNVTGEFPNHPNEDVTLRIPVGAEPDSEWNTTTDDSGGFSVVIEVPFAKDNTDTLVDFASVGLLAELDSDPTNEYAVATLVILLEEQTVQLTTGWNFVSTYLDLWNNDIEQIIDDEDYGIPDNYTCLKYYDEVEGWMSYVPGRDSIFNDMDHVNETMGIWIKVTDNVTLTFLGYPAGNTTFTLQPGWNLVGYPSSTPSVEDMPEEVTKVGYFDSSQEYNLSYDYSLDNFEFTPGEGYWLYNDADYDVDWLLEY
ncbi:MAG: hypothetical protein R6W73_03445 [Candidatus Saliniplasma sp.]